MQQPSREISTLEALRFAHSNARPEDAWVKSEISLDYKALAGQLLKRSDEARFQLAAALLIDYVLNGKGGTSIAGGVAAKWMISIIQQCPKGFSGESARLQAIWRIAKLIVVRKTDSKQAFSELLASMEESTDVKTFGAMLCSKQPVNAVLEDMPAIARLPAFNRKVIQTANAGFRHQRNASRFKWAALSLLLSVPALAGILVAYFAFQAVSYSVVMGVGITAGIFLVYSAWEMIANFSDFKMSVQTSRKAQVESLKPQRGKVGLPIAMTVLSAAGATAAIVAHINFAWISFGAMLSIAIPMGALFLASVVSAVICGRGEGGGAGSTLITSDHVWMNDLKATSGMSGGNVTALPYDDGGPVIAVAARDADLLSDDYAARLT